jgi:hypothetical protein
VVISTSEGALRHRAGSNIGSTNRIADFVSNFRWKDLCPEGTSVIRWKSAMVDDVEVQKHSDDALLSCFV